MRVTGSLTLLVSPLVVFPHRSQLRASVSAPSERSRAPALANGNW